MGGCFMSNLIQNYNGNDDGLIKGIVVNDSDFRVQYTVTAIYGTTYEIKNFEQFGPEGMPRGEPTDETLNNTEKHVESTITFAKNSGIVVVLPHSKQTSGLTGLAPGKYKLTLSIQTEKKDMQTMIKDVVIMKSTDCSLKVRKDRSIKNMMAGELIQQMMELEYFEVKAMDRHKYGNLDLPGMKQRVSMVDTQVLKLTDNFDDPNNTESR